MLVDALLAGVVAADRDAVRVGVRRDGERQNSALLGVQQSAAGRGA
jgi:hypothetical protein